MMKRFSLAVALSASVVLAPSAPAALVLVTYSGTIASGVDETDFFETGNADLTGLAFSYRIILQTDRPGANQASSDHISYISGYDQFDPVRSSRVTVNGVSIHYATPSDHLNYGYANQANDFDGDLDEVHHCSSSTRFYGGGSYDDVTACALIQSQVHSIADTSDLSAPLDYSVQPGDHYVGNFYIARYDVGTDTFLRNVSADLTVARVTISAYDGAVPEPAGWLTMVAGFGFVGGALRRRQVAASC